MIFSELDSALNLLTKAKGLFSKSSETGQETVKGFENIVVKRFVELFERHGVHRNQIPRFFGHDLKLKDVQNDEALLSILTDDVLQDACTLFCVRRDWLDGIDDNVYNLYDFYKHPGDFKSFLDKVISEQKSDQPIHATLIIPEKKSKNHEFFNGVLVIEEPIGYIGNKLIKRYHLCDEANFNYWKARAYTTACVAYSWKKEIYVSGKKIEAEVVQKYRGGEFIPSCGDEEHIIRGDNWYPEDMALSPKAFLEGVNPEKDDFGITSGLQLWLDLEKMGFMDTMRGKNGIREEFERELKKYKISV